MSLYGYRDSDQVCRPPIPRPGQTPLRECAKGHTIQIPLTPSLTLRGSAPHRQPQYHRTWNVATDLSRGPRRALLYPRGPLPADRSCARAYSDLNLRERLVNDVLGRRIQIRLDRLKRVPAADLHHHARIHVLVDEEALCEPTPEVVT